MTKKNFHQYVENRLDIDDHVHVVSEARAEAQLLVLLQKVISSMVIGYMHEHNATIDDLAHLLGMSVALLQKIKRGHATITLAKIVHICVVLKKDRAVLRILEKIDITI